MLFRIRQVVFNFCHEYTVSTITESWVKNVDQPKYESITFNKNDILLKVDERDFHTFEKVFKVIHKNKIFWIYEDELEEV